MHDALKFDNNVWCLLSNVIAAEPSAANARSSELFRASVRYTTTRCNSTVAPSGVVATTRWPGTSSMPIFVTPARSRYSRMRSRTSAEAKNSCCRPSCCATAREWSAAISNAGCCSGARGTHPGTYRGNSPGPRSTNSGMEST